MFTSLLCKLLLSVYYVIGTNVPDTENLPRNTQINAPLGWNLNASGECKGDRITPEVGININKNSVA